MCGLRELMARTVASAASRGLIISGAREERRYGELSGCEGEKVRRRQDKRSVPLVHRYQAYRRPAGHSVPLSDQLLHVMFTIPATTPSLGNSLSSIFSLFLTSPAPITASKEKNRRCTHVFAFLLFTYSASSRLTAKLGSSSIGSVARSTRASTGETEAHGRAIEALLSMMGGDVEGTKTVEQ